MRTRGQSRKQRMSLPFGRSIGVALLLAAGLFALVLALGSPLPSGVWGAPDCDPEQTQNMPDTYVDFQGTSGVSCTESTHDYPHEHTIEVDGGRDRELVFKAYIPGNRGDLLQRVLNDSIVIKFDKSFDLPDSLTLN